MINKELKYLNRRELVDIIYQLKRNEQEMQEEIKSLKTELQDKRIHISTAGSIADAAMAVTNVFSVAQMTADLYLHEISYMKEETEKECAKKIEDAEQKAKEIVADGEKKVKEILIDGEKKFETLKVAYKKEYAKLQQLRAQNADFEANEQESNVGVKNGK